MTQTITMEPPAIEGGARAKKTPFGREKRYGAAELQQLEEALEQETLFYTQGKKVRQLEEAFAQKNGVRFGIACTSGTTAIHTALMAAGISPGDEVITGPITDMGTVIPILFQGGIPVFADLEPYTHALSIAAIEAAITPCTRAVIAVQLWGNAADMNALVALCERHNLMLIEDCAQAFGCTYEGKPVGTFGKMGCFSFNEFKHISCGDGGMIITDDEELAVRLRLATDKCYDRRANASMRNAFFLANNYRMTELQGAVALAQLDKLDSIVARRQDWCSKLSDGIRSIPGLHVPTPTPGCNPSWWFYMLRIDAEVMGADADEFARALSAEGIPASAHYIGKPVYTYPLFVNHSAFDHAPHPFADQPYHEGLCPVAEEILNTAVLFGVNQAYTVTDLEETLEGFHKVAAWFQRKK